MISKKPYPWRLFWRIFIVQAISVVLALGLTAILTRFFLPQEAVQSLKFQAVLAFIILGLILGLGSAWIGRQLVFPIGRLILKAKKSGPDSAEEFENEPIAELQELEHSIDTIRKDLEAKTESLNRERSEQNTIMGSLSEAILAVDKEGEPLFFNSRFGVLFRVKEKFNLWRIFRSPEIIEAFKRALQKGESTNLRGVELEVDTGKMFFSISVTSLRREATGIYGAVGIFHDVTEMKKAEQMRIEFVANVSHELRTPLTSIKGYTDTILSDLEKNQPVDKSFVEAIHRNNNRLSNLINDLLDLSSLESTSDELQKLPLDTKEITEKVKSQLQRYFEAKAQDIVMTCSAETVVADARRLEQVLINLMDNASKYTQIRGKIFLSWEQDARTQGAVLKVKDTGPGIPKEHHDRLFERFYRVDKARSRELGGTGLGLAIVKHIMQRHGGTVSLESTLGQGTTFSCWFPKE